MPWCDACDRFLSPNTVHDHVKRIYQHFNVGSRAQLLARFVDVDRLNGHRL